MVGRINKTKSKNYFYTKYLFKKKKCIFLQCCELLVWKNTNYNIEFCFMTFLLSIGIRKIFNLNLNTHPLSKLKVYIVEIIGGLLYYIFIISE